MHAVLHHTAARLWQALTRARLFAGLLALASVCGAVVDRLVFRPHPTDSADARGWPSDGVPGAAVGTLPAMPWDSIPGQSIDAAELSVVALERRWRAVARISRSLLLGSRSPAEGSCVTRMSRSDLENIGPRFAIDLDGGPGTTISVLLDAGRARIRSATVDFSWHQSRLVKHLENQSALHAAALAGANDFFLHVERLVERLDVLRPADQSSWPDDLVAALPEPERDSWPGLCLARLSGALERRDLAGARQYARELSSAAWRLVDLHRWTVFLSENHLEALRFQALCRGCFEAADRAGTPYVVQSTPSGLPAGLLTLHGRDNYLEVERQAEQVFTVQKELLAFLQTAEPATGPALLVPPLLRPTFLALIEALGQANRATLVRAMRTPYESSFLINSMFRSKHAGTVADQCEVLRRLDRITPQASLERLMGVFVYRGHCFAGLDWSDRYTDVLHAVPLTGPKTSDAEAFRAACIEARDAFAARSSYGPTLTLRQSLETGVVDCVRATDMVLSRYRNDGRSGVGHVRWHSAGGGHSLPVLFDAMEGGRPMLVDVLAGDLQPDVWPDAYGAGATWPEVLGEQLPVQSVEFYVRGIDGYVWAQGLCIEGPAAGRLLSANVPYVSFLAPAPERVGSASPRR